MKSQKNSSLVLIGFISITLFRAICFADPNALESVRLNLTNETYVGADYPALINEICKKKTFTSVYTKHYYFVNNTKTKDETDTIVDFEKISEMLSDIALLGIQEKMPHEKMIDIINGLDKLDRKVVKQKPVGSINLEIHNLISLLISGFTFQISSNPDISELEAMDKIQASRKSYNFLEKSDYVSLLNNEVGNISSGENESEQELLVRVTLNKSTKSKELFYERYNSQPNSAKDIIKMGLFCNTTPRVSPFEKCDILQLTSAYYVVKVMSLQSRLAIDYQKLRLTEIDSKKLRAEFKNRLFLNMDETEMEYYSDIISDEDEDNGAEKLSLEIRGEILSNLQDGGKRILTTVYRRGKGVK